MSQQQPLDATTVPDNTGNLSPDSSPPDHPEYGDDDNYEYKCPYCGVSYQHELLTRVHITRSEDVNHLNHHGCMPETVIQVVTESGKIIDRISRRPEEIDMSSLSLSTFPDSVSEKHRYILLAAAQNIDEQTYTALKDDIETRFEKIKLSCPSYSTIRRVIRQFYRPQIASQDTEPNEGNNEETLSVFTLKQQAIIIARLASPEASAKEIADQVGCADSYPGQVFERAEAIITDLERKMEQDNDLQTIISDELTTENICELIERDLLTNLPIDSDEVINHGSDQENSGWGSPVGQCDVMSADPHSMNHDNQTNDPDSIEQPELTNNNGYDSNTTSSEDSNQVVPREEVERLREKIAFTRRIFNRTRSDGELVKMAKHIEDQFEEILQEATDQK